MASDPVSPESVDPDSLTIVHHPADVLRTKAHPVEATPRVIEVAQKMVGLMHDAPGIGLAAPQVGLPWRLFVADIPAEDPGHSQAAPGSPSTATDGPEIYIDPVISRPQGRHELAEEGCLSLPGITGDISRPPTVTMTYTDAGGNRISRKATGLLARCWQHELDHLNGVLILDRMSREDKERVRPAIDKLERAAEDKANP